jgi:alpha-tubulin suppressor-like RCC1 family protein
VRERNEEFCYLVSFFVCVFAGGCSKEIGISAKEENGQLQSREANTRNEARKGVVMSWGDGSSGALGHTESFAGDAYEAMEVPSLGSDIVGLGAGHYHSMAVTEAGELWAWGRNSEGQLGVRNSDSR